MHWAVNRHLDIYTLIRCTFYYNVWLSKHKTCFSSSCFQHSAGFYKLTSLFKLWLQCYDLWSLIWTSHSFSEYFRQADLSMLALRVVTACRPQWSFYVPNWDETDINMIIQFTRDTQSPMVFNTKYTMPAVTRYSTWATSMPSECPNHCPILSFTITINTMKEMVLQKTCYKFIYFIIF